MAGDASAEASQFKGLARYFNSTTMAGRANVSSAFIPSFLDAGFIGVIIIIVIRANVSVQGPGGSVVVLGS